MSEFLYGHRNGIHIIDLQKTVILFNEALKIVKIILQLVKYSFVGTASIRPNQNIKSCNQFFINKRWLEVFLRIGIPYKPYKKIKEY